MSRYHKATLHLLGGLMAGLLTVSAVQYGVDAVDSSPRTVHITAR